MMNIWLFNQANACPELSEHLPDHAAQLTSLHLADSLPEAAPAAILISVDPLATAQASIQQLRKQIELPQPPILVIAKSWQAADLKAAYGAGADDVISHSEITSLAVRLERQLQRSQYLIQLQQQLDHERKQLRHMAWHDPLTGLGNRQALKQFIQQDAELTLRTYRNWEHAAEDSNPADDDLAFMFLEVDHFRYLNDHYGQAFGDQVLLAIRDCLKDVFRETDTIVRWGGKTFLVISRKANRDSAGRLAERARMHINQTSVTTTSKGKGNGNGEQAEEKEEETEIRLSASIGISFFPFLQSRPKAFSWQEVVNVARLARDSAKASGRNAWVALNAASSKESELAYEPLKKNPMRQIASGALQVSTSFPDYHTLTWPPPV